MEVYKVADKVAIVKLDMVADLEVDKVADICSSNPEWLAWHCTGAGTTENPKKLIATADMFIVYSRPLDTNSDIVKLNPTCEPSQPQPLQQIVEREGESRSWQWQPKPNVRRNRLGDK